MPQTLNPKELKKKLKFEPHAAADAVLTNARRGFSIELASAAHTHLVR